MALQVFVFLLVVCLLLSLALLWRLDWFRLRPSSSPGGVKRTGSTVCSSPAAQTIAPPVDSPPLPRRVQGQRQHLCVPGVK